MASGQVPVTMGSASARTRIAGSVDVTEARFPAGAVLERHVHERPIVCVMLEGSFDHVGDRRSRECTPGTVLIEPAGDPHGNAIRRAGARVLVVEPEPSDELLRSVEGLLEVSAYFQHPGIVGRAHALARELSAKDAAAPLALEAGALDLLAVAARLKTYAQGAEPAWLRRVRDVVEDRFREPLRLSDLAREAGVHPDPHVARLPGALSRDDSRARPKAQARMGGPTTRRVRRPDRRDRARRRVRGPEPPHARAQGAERSDAGRIPARALRGHRTRRPFLPFDREARREAARRPAC